MGTLAPQECVRTAPRRCFVKEAARFSAPNEKASTGEVKAREIYTQKLACVKAADRIDPATLRVLIGICWNLFRFFGLR